MGTRQVADALGYSRQYVIKRAREKDPCGEDRRGLAVRSRERRGLRTADARVVAGEALGLEWSDIDLSLGTLRVNPKVQRM